MNATRYALLLTLLTPLLHSQARLGGTVENPTLINDSTKTIVAWAVRRNTAGVSPVLWAAKPILPGAEHKFGLSLTIREVGEGALLSYELLAVAYEDGTRQGAPIHIRRLEWEHRVHATTRQPQHRGKFSPTWNLYPGQTGTPIFGYNVHNPNYTGIISEGEQSPSSEAYAYCFSGPYVTYGTIIEGGVYQFNTGTCGDLTVHSTASEIADQNGTYFEMQQAINSSAVVNPVQPAILVQYEGCDYGGNYYPGGPGTGPIGSPWIQIQQEGYCYVPGGGDPGFDGN